MRASVARMLAVVWLAAAGTGGEIVAQALSSKNFFMSSVEIADGGVGFSGNFTGTVAVGAGAIPAQLFSSSFRITGGYSANLDVFTGGRPWVTHVTPPRVTTNGSSTVTLHGINLDLGSPPSIQVAGRPANLLSRTAEQILATQPPLLAPGYPAVSASNNLGFSGVAHSLGVLPLVECDPAPAPSIPFDIVFRGTRGDVVIWALALQPMAPLPLPLVHHGLAIDPAIMVMLPGFAISSADGVFRFKIPPTDYAVPLYVQAVFSSAHPGYAPGSFSNVLRL